jgi:hypothetical protein
LEDDIIFQKGHQLQPIEIKLSATYTAEFGRKLKKFVDLASGRAVDPAIIFTGSNEHVINGIKLKPWPEMTMSLQNL